MDLSVPRYRTVRHYRGGIMDRRVFLKLTGLLAAASAFEALPVAASPLETAPTAASAQAAIPAASSAASPSVARLRVGEAGTYQITGTVRLEASTVEISGVTNSQQMSWSGLGEAPVVSFSSFEQYAGPGLTPEIRVSGGQIESLSIVRLEYV
jgi:hypothetical protein